jgi:L-alanine-DL-glutamate epimerase-like enolase superfamily enzyme
MTKYENSDMKIRIDDACVFHLKAPIENKVKTSFGAMDSRNAVLLLLESDNGFQGVGESWVNFPKWASLERTAAFKKVFIPYLKSKEIVNIPSFIKSMIRDFRGQALQSGTMGPLMQSICAIEMALWDIYARMENIPLNKLIFKNPKKRVQLYASGINAPILWELIDEHLEIGIKLFKLKIGFGEKEDIKNLKSLRKYVGNSINIAVDANRAWNINEAIKWLDILKDFNVVWLEEPLKVEDEDKTQMLYKRKKIDIAAGENMLIEPDDDTNSLVNAPLDIFQPDITKYCCLNDAVKLLDKVEKRNKRFIPHFLGSAPGQATSFCLASGTKDGFCEWDINPNPLRTSLFKEPFEIKNGSIEIPDKPGIGWSIKSLHIKQG